MLQHIQIFDGKWGCVLLSNEKNEIKDNLVGNINLMLKKRSLPFSYYQVSVHSLSFLCSSLIVLNVTYKIWSLTCTSESSTTQLWKLDYLYVLYSSVARQQGAHLIHALIMLLFENIEFI